jgi:dolichyl-diphosphooligosaccharide--protein glycosyltransferase
LELPLWQQPFFQISGERLMATHDAYFWLAGAQGTSWASDEPLMVFLRFLHSITSAPLGNIAFYLPVLLAPVAGLPLCYLAWKQDMPEAGMAAGIMGTGCLGYLLRTRPGFCDTDPLALFVPAFVATALILWISPQIRTSWWPHGSAWHTRDNGSRMPLTSRFRSMGFQGILLGVACQACFWLYHQSSYIILAILGTCMLIALVLAQPGSRATTMFGLLCFHAVAFGGWIGLGCALVMTIALTRMPEIIASSRKTWSILILFGLVMVGVTGLHTEIWTILSKLIFLSKTSQVDTPSNGTSLLLPSVQQSIREAQNVDLPNLYSRISGNAFLFWLGLGAYVYLIWKRPLYLILAPVLVFSVFSFKLGNRFTMYGGIVWGLALSFGLSTLLASWKFSGVKRCMAQVILCLVIVWPIWEVAHAVRPSPILPQVYAQTLQDLGRIAPAKARLWQWWDYGYAAQYYAGRMSFGDGAKHSGPWLFPLALVHSTDSPAQAARMIRFTTAEQQNTFEQNSSQPRQKLLSWSVPSYLSHPTAGLEALGPRQAENLVNSMRTTPLEVNVDIPAQYFVVSWENLRLAYWISYFGNWDLITGKASPGKIQRLRGSIRMDTRQGILKSTRQTIPMDTLDIISETGVQHKIWPHGKGLHVLFNQLAQEIYVMDDKIYQSMMVQMLISPPEHFAPYFQLAVDHYPWARAYLVTNIP